MQEGRASPATLWSSHKDIAAESLRKLAGPHVPASLTKLEQAVKPTHTAYDKAERTVREGQPAEAALGAQGETRVDGDLADAA